ncbi:polysaccharide deacetylase family protein [Lacinutrix salivirga]
MPKLPILMYHSVTPHHKESKGLTISKTKLNEQFKFLKEAGYTTLHFADLQTMTSPKDFPEKAIIITFDDVYVNQLEYAYPLLKQYGFKACFYIPFEYVGESDTWNTGSEPIMTVKQLASLDPTIIELGLHSFSHQNFSDITLSEIDLDFKKTEAFIAQHQLPVSNVLAYPYGKYPKKQQQQTYFFDLLKSYKIAYGLRIGNRVNSFPFKNNYEVQRLDIKGEDTLTDFKRKIRKGKRWF